MDDPRRFLPLTPQQFHILLALTDGHLHGYAIIRDVADRTGERFASAPARSTPRSRGSKRSRSSRSPIAGRPPLKTTSGDATIASRRPARRCSGPRPNGSRRSSGTRAAKASPRRTGPPGRARNEQPHTSDRGRRARLRRRACLPSAPPAGALRRRDAADVRGAMPGRRAVRRTRGLCTARARARRPRVGMRRRPPSSGLLRNR